MKKYISLGRCFWLACLAMGISHCALPDGKNANTHTPGSGNPNVVAPPTSNGGAPPANPVTSPTLTTVEQLTQADGGPYYVGRLNWQDPNGPKMAWPGVSIYARFEGTGISITLDEMTNPANYSTASGEVPEGNQYDVSIDGNAPTVLVPQRGNNTYVLASALTNASHSVVVRKRTEALVGTSQFRGFTVQGSPLKPPAMLPMDRRIEVIGDSISAGYGVLGQDSNCHFSPATENETDAYGYVAATQLQAEIHVNAWSGKGVYRNNDGTTTATMPELYKLALPADANAMWDFNWWVPQAVVVNLSTNDFVQGVPSRPSFEGAYISFLGDIRANYPNAVIFCALGPMLSDNFPKGEMQLSTAREYIQSVVQSTGDPNIFFIEFPVQGESVACDFHPTSTTQAAMGQQLAQAIASKLGW